MFQRAHKRLHAARNGDQGFTLIEIMVVIVILGVLAGIVVFSVRLITDHGDNAACKTDKKDVQSAVEAYYAKFGQYPPAGIGSPADIGTPQANDSLIGAGVLRDAPAPGNWNIDSDGLVTVTGASCS